VRETCRVGAGGVELADGPRQHRKRRPHLCPRGGLWWQRVEPAGQTSVASTATSPTTTAETQALVGRWERVNECPHLVKALDDADLNAIAPSVVGDYFPGISAKKSAKKADPCAGAEPFVHSHFFTDSGAFGSLTEDLQQVDDGTYAIIDDTTFRIGTDPGVEFHYEIDGDTLSLSPVITKAMVAKALAHPLEFSDAGWSVAVAYPGQTWKRVDCSGWC
jgi:hypothetical protein